MMKASDKAGDSSANTKSGRDSSPMESFKENDFSAVGGEDDVNSENGLESAETGIG